MTFEARQALRVITDHGSPQYFTGIRRPIVLSRTLQRGLARLPGGSAVAEVLWGCQCWLVSLALRRDLPIVTCGYGHGWVFAFLQYLWRWCVPPRTHIVFDLLLDHPRRAGLAARYERFKARVFNRVIDLAVVWGQVDVDRYAEAHGLARERLQFHPFHTTLEGYEFEIRDDGYLFAGGNAARDYTTLIDALRTVDYPVFIATTRPEVAAHARHCPHITVQGLSPAEFRRRMAAATFVVECHAVDFFRTGGHQTFLNAFWMGKTIVMADRQSAVGYFSDGVEGFVVDHGDVAGLRDRVQRLLADPELRRRMAARAQQLGRQARFDVRISMQSIYNLAIGRDGRNRGYDPSARLIALYGNGAGPEGSSRIRS